MQVNLFISHIIIIQKDIFLRQEGDSDYTSHPSIFQWIKPISQHAQFCPRFWATTLLDGLEVPPSSPSYQRPPLCGR